MARKKPILNRALRIAYATLFETCTIAQDARKALQVEIDSIQGGIARYRATSLLLGGRIPPHVIGVIHRLECDCNFNLHLHNGDSLKARTKRVPAGRPRTGNPPFTWEESARDALTYLGFDTNRDWSVSGTSYMFESYNGFGYRNYHPNVISPYMYGKTNHHTKGKYTADGKFDPNAITKDFGVMALLKHFVNIGECQFMPEPAGEFGVLYDDISERAGLLQLDINQMMKDRGLKMTPLKADKHAGAATSLAYKRIYGEYLPGDPRLYVA